MINLVRTTLVDNNTWNNSHIAMVGKAMASNEDDAYTIMQELGVDYVLVIFGGLLGKFHYPQIFSTIHGLSRVRPCRPGSPDDGMFRLFW